MPQISLVKAWLIESLQRAHRHYILGDCPRGVRPFSFLASTQKESAAHVG